MFRKEADLGTGRLDPVREHRRHSSEFSSKASDIIITTQLRLSPSILVQYPSPSHITYHTMFQRTILRASRQQAARSIRPFAPLGQPVGITRAAATPAIRWYSNAAPAKEGEAAEKKEEAPAADNETTQVKEQAEKKDKEIVELKVHNTLFYQEEQGKN
jgi:hypothetical protein